MRADRPGRPNGRRARSEDDANPMRIRAVRAVAIAALCAVIAGACSRSPTTAPPSSPSTPSPGVTPPPSPSPTLDCAQRALHGMTEAQRIGQLLMVGLPDAQLSPAVADAVDAHHFGNVLFVSATSAGVAGVRQVTDAVQALRSPTST